MSSGLELSQVGVRFGGLVAVDTLDLVAPRGRITGLIGPNGAGKSTTFNACFGTVACTGSITLDQRDITKLSTPARARAGLGRTFQRVQLFDTMTVRENVLLGVEGAHVGARPTRYLLASPRRRRAALEAANAAIARCGIGHLGDARPGSLSLGQRRLVELARAVAGNHSMLLLDEPASGLDSHESETFSTLIRSIVAEGDIGILIVEHDIPLVARTCDHVYVIDFGRLVFDGTPEAVLASEVVRSAYLGSMETT